MLKNFIKTSDLKSYYPNISDNLWPNTSDYSSQISQGWQWVYNDLWIKDIDPRQVMVPITLSGVGIEAPSDFKRFAFTVTSANGTLTLQGSHDNLTFYTIATIDTSTMTDYLSDDVYKYYKYTSTVPMTSVLLYENVFDRCIVFASLALIFRDFMKEAGDVWDIKRQLVERDYDNAINSVKFYLDANDNQTVDIDTEIAVSGDITFER